MRGGWRLRKIKTSLGVIMRCLACGISFPAPIPPNRTLCHIPRRRPGRRNRSALRIPYDPGGLRQQPAEIHRRKVLVPYLKSQGVTRLDLAVMTHGDQDHMNGIRYLLEHPESGIRVGGLMMPEAGKDEIYGKMAELAKKRMFLFFMPKREIYGITFREKECPWNACRRMAEQSSRTGMRNPWCSA